MAGQHAKVRRWSDTALTALVVLVWLLMLPDMLAILDELLTAFVWGS